MKDNVDGSEKGRLIDNGGREAVTRDRNWVDGSNSTVVRWRMMGDDRKVSQQGEIG
jgi:hypothetical protein